MPNVRNVCPLKPRAAADQRATKELDEKSEERLQGKDKEFCPDSYF
jgi:hypothetical protein